MDNKKFWMFAVICILVAALYFILPVDFIPDLIVGIGWIDDLVVSLLGLAGLIVSVLGACGVLPTPQRADGWQRDYENYGDYREC